MNSDSSAVTADFFEAPTTANAATGQSMVWTNEKHKLYLDLLEASFVDKLNCSRSLSRPLPQEKPCNSYSFQSRSSMYNTEKKFVVRQDEHQQKMNTESIEQPLDSTADSEDILGSPWIHHSKPAGKCIRSSSSKSQDILGEEEQQEKMKEKRRPGQRGHGSKSVLVDNTSLDQVVPSGTLGSIDDSTNMNACLRRGKKRLQSGYPGRIAGPKKLDMF